MQEDEVISEDAFLIIYQPIDAPSGSLVWEFDELPEGIDPHHVWSVIDGDEDDNQYAAPGFHIVNVFGYSVTRGAWVTGEEEAIWSEFEHDFDEATA
jgi:hypothetical protein